MFAWRLTSTLKKVRRSSSAITTLIASSSQKLFVPSRNNLRPVARTSTIASHNRGLMGFPSEVSRIVWLLEGPAFTRQRISHLSKPRETIKPQSKRRGIAETPEVDNIRLRNQNL